MLSSLRRAGRVVARRAIYPACEALWVLGLRLAAPLVVGSTRPRHLFSPGGLRMLVLAAHPDDETVGCGGAVLRHKQAGDHVTVVIITDGGAARGAGLPHDQAVRLRGEEARATTALLGVDRLDHWALPEMGWQQEDVAARLAQLLRSERPDVIYAHSLVDYHPEHRKVAAALAQALAGLERPMPYIRAYELGVPLGLLANLRLDLRPFARRKITAITAYGSQRDIMSVDRRRTRYNGALFGGGRAEVFWELSGADYARVMSGAPGPMYRSLRERPLTDPLAYVDFGRRARLARSARCKVQSAK